jgi:hypothetical protein
MWEARKRPVGCEQWGKFCCHESRKQVDQKRLYDSIQWDIENSFCPPKPDDLFLNRSNISIPEFIARIDSVIIDKSIDQTFIYTYIIFDTHPTKSMPNKKSRDSQPVKVMLSKSPDFICCFVFHPDDTNALGMPWRDLLEKTHVISVLVIC